MQACLTSYFVLLFIPSRNPFCSSVTDGLFRFSDTNAASYWDRVSGYALKNLDVLKDDVPHFIVKLLDSFKQDNESDFDDDVSLMVIRKS